MGSLSDKTNTPPSDVGLPPREVRRIEVGNRTVIVEVRKRPPENVVGMRERMHQSYAAERRKFYEARLEGLR